MAPQFEFLMGIAADVGELTSMGGGPLGERRVVAITGGTFEGPALKGSIVPGGADWQIARADGVLDIDARYALRTLRLLHYSAWIARRWDDPAFPAAFPWFNTQRYWQDRILELREQIALMDEPPLERP